MPKSFLTGIVVARQTRRVDNNALKNADKSTEWLTYGHTHAEQRYRPLKQIDTTNVARLGLAWSFEVGEGGGNQEATPLFANGVLYGITNWSITFAVDARTGKELWRWDPEVDRALDNPQDDSVCCGPVNRGLGLYGVGGPDSSKEAAAGGIPTELDGGPDAKQMGDRVIVQAIEEEETTASGIVLPDTAKEKPQKGKVIAVGEGAWDEDGEKRIPLDVAEGDEVLYSKYGGTEVKVDGDDLLVLRESDVLAKVV